MNERPSVHRPVLHPSAGSDWFRALPHERRARMNREWRESLARDRGLVQNERRRLLRGALELAAVFAVFDGLCPGDSLALCTLAFTLGGVLGLVLEHLGAARLLTASLAMLAFFLFQWFSRGTLVPLQLFWFVPVGGSAGYLALRREE